MMDLPLTAWTMFAHTENHFADVPLVSGWSDGRIERTTYGEFAARSQQLMHGLDALGLPRDATVATLAWNSHRHLEAYFGVPCTGRTLHTLNLRLSPEELGYIIGHAGDDAILVDPDLLPLLEKVHAAGGLDRVRHIVVLGTEVPDSDLPGIQSYEALLAAQPTQYAPPQIDERARFGICYTSGTTGRPKGVVYTHRSTVLHAFGVATGAGFSIGPTDATLPVVPMFHANAWGVPFAATLVGAKQVFLGGPLDCARLVDLLVDEAVTISAGVPTVWFDVAEELSRRGAALPDLRHVVCGGSRPPNALITRYREDFGVSILQAWGMTETSPLASVAWPKHHLRDLDPAQMLDTVSCQAGVPLPSVELSIRDDEGTELPWDGASMGRLLVRGPWVADSYLAGDGSEQFEGGWFVTGDVAVGTPGGYFHIADRTKDLIKSGGEWISSVDMESALMAWSAIAEAAVIAVPDPRWQERPLACVVLRDDTDLDEDAVRAHLLEHGFAKWQLPDQFQVVAEIPRTSVGKFDKLALRAQFTETAARS
jgi:fatty-acyl-CoA synthase